MIASTIKIIRIIFSIIHQVISTVFSTYIIRFRSNHLPFIYQMIKFIIKFFVVERDHITSLFIRQSDALSPQKSLIYFEISVSIIHFFVQRLSHSFFVYIISLFLSLFLHFALSRSSSTISRDLSTYLINSFLQMTTHSFSLALSFALLF